MSEFTAKFLSVEAAVRYAESIRQPGNWATNVVQKGRTVTFDKAIPEGVDSDAHRFYFQDQLEKVGYYGSTQSRKATLNGVKAPFVW